MAGNWLAELDGSGVTVEVPASAANLGAGYDCLGLAMALVNRIELEVRVWSRGEIELTVEGEGRNELTEDRDNRFVRGLEAALEAARGQLPDGVGWRIAMHNQIPLSRGLGSSAAATVGGVLAGNALAGEPLSTAEMLRIACDIEGHPDNAAASLLGGFVVSAATDEGVEAIRFASPRDLRAVLFIPELRLPTDGDAGRPAGVGAAGRRGGQPRGRRGRGRRAGDRALRPAGAADRRSAARAVPRGHLPAAAEDGRGGQVGRGAGRVPVGGRLDDPRLRRLDGRDHPDRGRLLRRAPPMSTCPVASRSSTPRNAGARVRVPDLTARERRRRG